MKRIAFYGSSLLSAYWNGAATYYRGLLRALAAYGYDIVFYEPDAFDRQSHRDIDPPDWAKVVVWPSTAVGLRDVTAQAAAADIVVKASGVGVYDDEILELVMQAARPGALRIFWDVDAPATIAALQADPAMTLGAGLADLDLVLTYGGGPPVVSAYRALGARACVPIYNGLDPETHFPVPADPNWRADLAFLGNRLPDRESRVTEFLSSPAATATEAEFLLGGSGWETLSVPANVRRIGHVPTDRHNAFNSSPRAVLNIARDSMAATGYSPATRVFEAAGAGACIITDAWEGIEMFLQPGAEILVARDGADVVDHLRSLSPDRAKTIGAAARRRCLENHTYEQRARQVHALFEQFSA
jgi:spore maturation protein CgeB